MPATVRDLIDEGRFPVCIKINSSASHALEIMIENDFSQLPVIDDDNYPKGLVTTDSILRGLANLNIKVKDLQIRDVIQKHHAIREDEIIFDLLDALENRTAVLITNVKGQIKDIVTYADVADYFRQRAEDMMLVEDIETALKDHIDAAFTNAETGNLDADELQNEIDKVYNSQKVTTVRDAIKAYHENLEDGKTNADSGVLKKVCDKYTELGKGLNDLTLDQLSKMMLNKKRWETYGQNFSVTNASLENLFKEIRDIRNILAHFRDELSPAQREKLRWCADWFQRNPPILPEIKRTEIIEEVGLAKEEPEIVPLTEPESEIDNRYAKLALYLQEQTVERVRLTFNEVENIIGSPLPPSAYQHRSWWANDSKSHVQSQQWLDAGWRVSSINMTEGAVAFVRAKEREAAYISFFAPLLNELKEKAPFTVRDDTLIGTNWLNVFSAYDPNSQYTTNFAFTFARGRRFRAELYIYAPEVNDKRVFDQLIQQKTQIEEELGEKLSWERLEGTKATRLGLYCPGHITDTPDELDNLRKWAVDAIIRLERVTHDRVNAVVKAL